jgi:hypothetical protein
VAVDVAPIVKQTLLVERLVLNTLSKEAAGGRLMLILAFGE